MNIRAWLSSSRTRLDIAAGMVDGVLNALILAAGSVLKPAGNLGLGLTWHVGAASALTTLFVFFVAHYAELRAELVRTERQLNLSAHGRLAASRLGQRALREAGAGAALAASCGFVGATFPLLLSMTLPGPGWIGLSVTIIFLGVLGAILARSFYGSMLLWSGLIMIGGILLTFIGLRLHLVG